MIRDEVLQVLKEVGATQWQLADAMGSSEPTMTRWLRYPLEGERLKRVQEGLLVLRKEAV